MSASVVQISAPRKNQSSQVDARRPFARDACNWSEAAEHIAATHLRIAFAWQRLIIRACWGL